jgi:hypothetical protein
MHQYNPISLLFSVTFHVHQVCLSSAEPPPVATLVSLSAHHNIDFVFDFSSPLNVVVVIHSLVFNFCLLSAGFV